MNTSLMVLTHQTRHLPRLARLLAGVVPLVLLLLLPLSAGAHAQLESSTIGAGAILPSVPESITLTFSESVDPAFASGSLVTSSRDEASPVSIALDPGNDRSAVFTIVNAGALPAGSYALVWRVVSAVDGHATSGLLSFSAGTGVSPDLASSTASAGIGWPATIGRWLELAGLFSVAGAGAFAAIAGYRAPIPGLLRRVTLFAVPVALFGVVLTAGALLGATTGDGWGAWPGWNVAKTIFSDTSPGRALLIRTAAMLGIALVGLLVRYRAARQAALAALLAGTGMAGYSFTGHAAGLHGVLAIAVDLVHLLVAALWSGGLLLLALALRALLRAGGAEHLTQALRLSRRFSALAFVSLGLVTVTGIISAVWNVSGPRNLTGEDYGLLLIAKIVLVLVIITVAAVNRLLLIPRLTAAIKTGPGDEQAARDQTDSLSRAALIEIGIALAVLLLTARFTGLPPANGPLTVEVASRSGPITIAATAGDLQFLVDGELQNRPDGMITVAVVDVVTGAPVGDLARLIVLATAPNPLDPNGEPLRDRFDATPVDGSTGRYTFPRSRLGVEAVWDLDITARRLGLEDAVASMEIDLQGTAPPPPRLVDDRWRWPKIPWTGWLSMAAAAATVTGGLLLVRRLRGLEPVTAGIMLAVTALITIGFLLSAYRSGPLPIDGAPIDVPGDLADDVVIQRAAGSWAQQCASCHGLTAAGAGDEPASAGQSHTHPSVSGDLLGASSRALTSQERYWAITNGIGGSGMPAFDIALNDRQRWDLVAYLEWLQGQAED